MLYDDYLEEDPAEEDEVEATYLTLLEHQRSDDGLVLADAVLDETAGDLDAVEDVPQSFDGEHRDYALAALDGKVRDSRRRAARKLSQAELRRFARKYRTETAAVEAVRRHAAWHAAEEPELLRMPSGAPDVNAGVLRVQGRSRDGDAILVFDANPWEPWNYGNTNARCSEQFRAYVAYRLQVASLIADAEMGSQQFIVVVNIIDRPSLLRPVALRCVYTMIRLTLDHFPNRLKLAFLLGAPPLFSAAWNIIKPWLDPDTIQRTHFLQDSNVLPVLEQYLSHDAANAINLLRSSSSSSSSSCDAVTPPRQSSSPRRPSSTLNDLDIQTAADAVLSTSVGGLVL